MVIISAVLGSCATMEKSGISPDMIFATVGAASKAARSISEDEEYYIGRAVAASLISQFRLLENKELTDYVNHVGQAVALHSDKPQTYGGYHFAILDSSEINAFACPGGMIFITRGMLNAVRNEDELAAVLAHEVGHISHRDGISAIKKARWTEAVTIIGSKAAREYGSKELSSLVNIFEGSIDDIVKTLVVNGYGQSQEYDADKAALGYLAKAGYNPGALKDFIGRLITKGRATEGGLLKTHPATSDRLKEVENNMPSVNIDQSSVQLRAKRFLSSVR
ncbi:MAG TPA: peptidase M48 [Nitrospiraceae bacterium]|nr:peptidase M48 [Nitrospiraceae bacterium]